MVYHSRRNRSLIIEFSNGSLWSLAFLWRQEEISLIQTRQQSNFFFLLTFEIATEHRCDVSHNHVKSLSPRNYLFSQTMTFADCISPKHWWFIFVKSNQVA